MFRRFDIISPWNVGNYMEVAGERHAATNYWRDDMAEAKKAGMNYLPVIIRFRLDEFARESGRAQYAASFEGGILLAAIRCGGGTGDGHGLRRHV